MAHDHVHLGTITTQVIYIFNYPPLSLLSFLNHRDETVACVHPK